jgi:hypothetical protein
VTQPPPDKGFRRRKREDHALTLLHEIEESLGDIARVKRLLLELGRYYDPVLGGGIVDPPLQKAIVAALESGRVTEARALIQARYDAYMKDRAHLGREDA